MQSHTREQDLYYNFIVHLFVFVCLLIYSFFTTLLIVCI